MLREFSTSLGHMALATLNGEVVGLTFGHPSAERALKSLSDFHRKYGSTLIGAAADDTTKDAITFVMRVAKKLELFADGEPTDFDDIAVSLTGMTIFQKQVVAECRAIPWGETVSYGELAASVGHPGAARAVGTVMRKNRVPLIVPCHRVLASGGQLGGYSAPSGLEMKRRLLMLEKSQQLATLF